MNGIRWGMIGVGDVAERKSGPAFNLVADARLTAVAGRRPDRARRYAERHGVARWHPDAAALVAAPEVDAVYVATPPAAHEPCVRLAAAAGKPVYVEKPMGRSTAECRRMIETCRAAGVELCVAYYRRRLPKFLKARELILAGAIGAVRAVTVALHLPPRADDRQPGADAWRLRPEVAGPGGYFMDLASHQFDLLNFLLGPIADAGGVAASQAGLYAVEDAVAAHWRFERGALGAGSWCFTVAEPAKLDRIDIVGAEGRLSFSTFDNEPVRLANGDGPQTFEPPAPQFIQQPMIAAVTDCLLGRGPNPCDGATALRANEGIESILGGGCGAPSTPA